MKLKAALLVVGGLLIFLAIGFKEMTGKGEQEANRSKTVDRDNFSASELNGLAGRTPSKSSSSRISELETEEFTAAELKFEEAKTRLSAGQGSELFKDAELALSEFIDSYPDSKKLPLVRYRIGVAQLYTGRRELAEENFGQVLLESNGSGYAAGNSAYRLGALSYNDKEYEKALPMFRIALTEAQTEGMREQAAKYPDKITALLEDARE